MVAENARSKLPQQLNTTRITTIVHDSNGSHMIGEEGALDWYLPALFVYGDPSYAPPVGHNVWHQGAEHNSASESSVHVFT